MALKLISLRSVGTFFLALTLLGNVSLMDTERLYAAPSSMANLQGEVSKLVDINEAGSEELQAVRGIGPTIAERIIQYRDENGRFEQPDDLANVRGIGGAKLQQIKHQVST